MLRVNIWWLYDSRGNRKTTRKINHSLCRLERPGRQIKNDLSPSVYAVFSYDCFIKTINKMECDVKPVRLAILGLGTVGGGSP